MKEIPIMVNIVGHERSLTLLDQNIRSRAITHLSTCISSFLKDDHFICMLFFFFGVNFLYVVQLQLFNLIEDFNSHLIYDNISPVSVTLFVSGDPTSRISLPAPPSSQSMAHMSLLGHDVEPYRVESTY